MHSANRKPREVTIPSPAMVEPALMTSEDRKRLSGPGLRAFLAIADHWQLSEKDRLTILGQPSRSAYYGWVKKAQSGEDIVLSVDTLLRISALLGIHKALTILFHDPAQALIWLKGPHLGLPFSGQAPLSLALSGTQDGLLTLRRYLDAWRGGSAAHPHPDVDAEPVSPDDLVFG